MSLFRMTVNSSSELPSYAATKPHTSENAAANLLIGSI